MLEFGGGKSETKVKVMTRSLSPKKRKKISLCCEMIIYIPPNSYVDTLIPRMMVFADVAFGK